MTLFGIIWMIATMIAFFYPNIKPMFFLTLFGMIFQCNNVIAIGTFYVGPQLITSTVFIVKSLFDSSFVIRHKRKNTKIIICILCLYIYIIFNTIFWDRFHSIWLNIIQLGIYIFCFICMIEGSRDLSKEYIIECIKKITIFIIIVGLIQLGYDLLEFPRYTIFRDLFYNDNIGGSVCFYRNVKRFYSTFMEPSYCAGILAGLIFFFLEVKNTVGEKKSWIYIISLLSCLLLTESSTAYGTIAIVGLVYVLININKRYVWKLVPLGIIGLLILYFCTDFLDTAIFDKMMTSSGRTRMRLDHWAYESFKKSPWIGIGYKEARASSLISTMLGELGVFGGTLYLISMVGVLYNILVKNADDLLKGVSYIVFCIIISMFIACPDLDLCIFWMAMYVFAMVIGSKNDIDVKI